MSLLWVVLCALVLAGVAAVVALVRRRGERRAFEVQLAEESLKRSVQAAVQATAMKYAPGGVYFTPGLPPAPAWSITGNAGVRAVKQKGDASHFGGLGETQTVVYGLRNWSIDPLGRLAGMVYKAAVWMPGVNEARCMRGVNSYTMLPTAGGPLDHPMDDCGHGFYAYYDGSRDYHERGAVTGIIRGWGTTEVGDKGFRCTRAEIVAIKFSDSTTQMVRDRVRDLYPGAAVFKSVNQMLAEYPLTVNGLEFIPEIDDDFWTREA